MSIHTKFEELGRGMRIPNNIWGMWNADNTFQQMWNQVQNKLGQYSSKRDILYEDPTYPAANQYAISLWEPNNRLTTNRKSKTFRATPATIALFRYI